MGLIGVGEMGVRGRDLAKEAVEILRAGTVRASLGRVARASILITCVGSRNWGTLVAFEMLGVTSDQQSNPKKMKAYVKKNDCDCDDWTSQSKQLNSREQMVIE